MVLRTLVRFLEELYFSIRVKLSQSSISVGTVEIVMQPLSAYLFVFLSVATSFAWAQDGKCIPAFIRAKDGVCYKFTQKVNYVSNLNIFVILMKMLIILGILGGKVQSHLRAVCSGQ